jgi:hypothetical protein
MSDTCKITASQFDAGPLNKDDGTWVTIKATRDWNHLTPTEVGELTVFDGLDHIETDILANFVWAIEAKCKEKNGG